MFIVFALFQEDPNELRSTGSSSSRDQGGSTSEAERVVMYRCGDDEKEADDDHHFNELDGYGGGNGTSMVEGFICSSAIIVAKVVVQCTYIVQCKWWFVDDVGDVGELDDDGGDDWMVQTRAQVYR